MNSFVHIAKCIPFLSILAWNLEPQSRGTTQEAFYLFVVQQSDSGMSITDGLAIAYHLQSRAKTRHEPADSLRAPLVRESLAQQGVDCILQPWTP
jgi:hypothetical protein